MKKVNLKSFYFGYIIFNNTLYKQIGGVMMGSRCGL